MIGYAYPWDTDLPYRATDLGVDEVAVATSYHSTRAATPYTPGRSAVLARHSAVYRPSTVTGRLRPAAADWTPPDSAGTAIRALHDAGVRTAAWIVLAHNSLLGNRFPDVAVRNCFGEPYPWALCPSAAEVREYCAGVAADSVRDLPVDGVILESLGQLGAVHQHEHEKTEAAWSPAATQLLSVCCCTHCRAAWGHDAESIVDTVALRTAERIADPSLITTGLPADLAAQLLETRHRATDALRSTVLCALPAGLRITLHGNPDPWATGPLPGITASTPGDIDALVVPCWQHGVPTVAAAPSTVDIGAYVTAVGPAPLPHGSVAALAGAGATELHLYHIGLAGPARSGDLRAAVKSAHAKEI